MYALLISGSNTWDNYRHQADVCHAYQILKAEGVDPNNIITMLYDDIAFNRLNPFPGQIFNNQNMKDVYSGVKIDYRGADVTVPNFQNILLGLPTNVGSGRVLQTTSEDNILIYFSDHGNTGFVGFPNHQVLTAKQIHVTLNMMIQQRKFNDMVIYIEACFSGSLFNGILKNDSNIYAMTASNERETSYGNTDSIQDITGARVVLGDSFSSNLLNSIVFKDLTTTTLDEQFAFVQNATKMSHVKRYGSTAIGQQTVAEFLQIIDFRDNEGDDDMKFEIPENLLPPSTKGSLPSCVMPELLMMERFDKTSDMEEKRRLGRHLKNVFDVKNNIEKHSMEMYVDLMPQFRSSDPIMDPRLPPLRITQLDCHDQVVRQFAVQCPEMMDNDFKNHFIATMTNLCEQMVPASHIIQQMIRHCT
ncbi:unnamed protein product [Bursaphelenchus okinawaensis]|uniref:legumain n=1 Tax=Bursaphelenchus okinawaensis TaxID=465554 RepID=A0A811KDU3_9BILA|nr:unnamed protein product [Bursaphelenchus okinawaensis]CAG9101870.1 unnamed protein product [Bursaphelenchus okinawaensis]